MLPSVSAASRSERTVTARGMKAFFDVSGLLVSLRVLMGSTSVFFIGCLNQFPEIGEASLISVYARLNGIFCGLHKTCPPRPDTLCANGLVLRPALRLFTDASLWISDILITAAPRAWRIT